MANWPLSVLIPLSQSRLPEVNVGIAQPGFAWANARDRTSAAKSVLAQDDTRSHDSSGPLADRRGAMSRLRMWIISALILGQALALTAGTLLYYQPVKDAAGGAFDRTWLVGVLTGVLAALWTSIVVRLVLRGCEAGFANVKVRLDNEIRQ